MIPSPRGIVNVPSGRNFNDGQRQHRERATVSCCLRQMFWTFFAIETSSAFLRKPFHIMTNQGFRKGHTHISRIAAMQPSLYTICSAPIAAMLRIFELSVQNLRCSQTYTKSTTPPSSRKPSKLPTHTPVTIMPCVG